MLVKCVVFACEVCDVCLWSVCCVLVKCGVCACGECVMCACDVLYLPLQNVGFEELVCKVRDVITTNTQLYEDVLLYKVCLQCMIHVCMKVIL